MAYMFFLKKCLLPVTPSKLNIKINNANKTVTLIDEGEINILKTAALTDISFECMIPQNNYPFAVFNLGFVSASMFLDYFEGLKTSKKPFQFIVVRTRPNGIPLFNTNIKVAMEDYTVKEDWKQGIDLIVKIALKQYRDYGTKTVKIKEGDSAETPEATAQNSRSQETSPMPEQIQTYTAKTGDTLFNIAKSVYGDGELYTKILEGNGGISSPNNISPGQAITIHPCF